MIRANRFARIALRIARATKYPLDQAIGSLHSGTIAIGTYDGALLVLSAADGKQKFGYAPHIGCVKSLHCSQVGRLASGGADNMVRLFNLAKAR